MRAKQQEIINALKVQPVIDPKAEIRRSIDFLKAYLKKYPFLKTLVLGISGGQDSTLAGKLSQLAISELRDETGDTDYQFIAVRLPYGVQADESDALAAIDYMKADKVVRVDIKPAVDAAVDSVETNGIQISDFNKGNIKARQRMIAQYAIAGGEKGAVVGTDHAAEAVTGFYTKFGDGAADITPLWRLDKRQGKQLLNELGAPEHLYKKVPTADLEDNRPALPDEVALGVTYQDIDDYLEGKVVSQQAAETIEGWYIKTEHKRHTPINVYDTFWK
ncbi:MAG: ammonia-dependent NAD(+) synthetase [Lentilactobacillus diolivorans]|jgi:NAD+ synthase|uniref:NH(3)-dependent NAD(+) synthetase n=2 Tax=Lentilactobacillus diolivorans TaxID=179838 RepID=A0A0R1SCM6_9LACO|nr:ammonia-dependent NAD(+) synthetase [Lentilactobacillus diolivorans]RRG00849.1 MAG: ammonia-dependent NAD(+) synthetase [Lactobacillus sp.]KRL64362.1 NAD+ synthase [Lentilactobacillus diolivorans DSM 14421]MCH4165881.1 ammonia-dependent NAD(+) synthetase [Lentilactobacillus diolivorans]MDH5105732.1 ammonia-dependent NAD(+) synthetase [Lentilactobacillus diolivorans]GEP24939.1 NH(3)-dependent NAD(+) synthetase [Lentilactobacillus diolivorans]